MPIPCVIVCWLGKCAKPSSVKPWIWMFSCFSKELVCVVYVGIKFVLLGVYCARLWALKSFTWSVTTSLFWIVMYCSPGSNLLWKYILLCLLHTVLTVPVWSGFIWACSNQFGQVLFETAPINSLKCWFLFLNCSKGLNLSLVGEMVFTVSKFRS